MAKKIVAFSAGKTNGNTETYMKITLEEARNMGPAIGIVLISWKVAHSKSVFGSMKFGLVDLNRRRTQITIY